MLDATTLSPLDRFAFGFAEPGEHVEHDGLVTTFLGEFAQKNVAKSHAAIHNGKVRGYLHGKLKRGWVVLRTMTKREFIIKTWSEAESRIGKYVNIGEDNINAFMTCPLDMLVDSVRSRLSRS